MRPDIEDEARRFWAEREEALKEAIPETVSFPYPNGLTEVYYLRQSVCEVVADYFGMQKRIAELEEAVEKFCKDECAWASCTKAQSYCPLYQFRR